MFNLLMGPTFFASPPACTSLVTSDVAKCLVFGQINQVGLNVAKIIKTSDTYAKLFCFRSLKQGRRFKYSKLCFFSFHKLVLVDSRNKGVRSVGKTPAVYQILRYPGVTLENTI